MDFLLRRSKHLLNWKSVKLGNYFLYYHQNNAVERRELLLGNENYLIIGDVNISFANTIRYGISKETILNNIEKLTNGYIIIYDKILDTISIYNDIFGFYHLFCIHNDNDIIVSSDFKFLLNSASRKIDNYALFDILLFNYTLFDRTLIKDIRRLMGGSELIIRENDCYLNVKYNFAEKYILPDRLHYLSPNDLGDILVGNISKELDKQLDIQLTMTGGFDSRALLAACSNMGLNFSTFTFGQKGNIEIETTKPFINKYSKEHKIFELDNKFINNLPGILKEFIEVNKDNPTILDLPQYSFIKNQLPSLNIITGFMGGEIMAGQSVGAQVTFTDFAAEMIKAQNVNDLSGLFDYKISITNIFNPEQINEIKDNYLNTLKPYFHQCHNLNLLRFLINEKYSKFFGTVNKVFKNHSNLIIPFMNVDYLRMLLSSEFSFLKKPPFKQNPLRNLKYKISYAKMIKYLKPELGTTKFDRLYKLNDLTNVCRLPIAGMGYVNSHVLKINKKYYPRPHHYDLWYENIMFDEFKDINFNAISGLLREDFSFVSIDYKNLPDGDKKIWSNLLGFKLATDMILKAKF